MFTQISILPNSQNDKFILSLNMIIFDVDNLISTNLSRIIKKYNISQNKLAAMIGTTPVTINQIIKNKKGMGKDILERICKTLNIEPAEFYIQQYTPIANSELQKRAVYETREAEGKHFSSVAEESIEYIPYRIKQIKKATSKGTDKGKPTRYKTR